LKPIYGTVSLQGIEPLSRTLDHVGPITKTVKDAAIMLQAISENRESDELRFHEIAELSGLRIGVIREFLEDEMLDTEVALAIKASRAVFESCGAAVDNVSIPWIKNSIQVAATLIPAEAASTLWPAVRASRESVGRDVYTALQNGSRIPASEYLNALSLRSAQIEKMRRIFTDYDILLCPTTLMTATPIGRKRAKVRRDGLRSVEELFPRYLAVFDVLGNPALSLPCGFDSSGLPIGLQIVGRNFEEGRVLTVGHAFECRTPWHRARPPL
jgi:aspartyl-tRNA(Asn)/glutamyl-tRNA(Gln) amidotransferase subunit A